MVTNISRCTWTGPRARSARSSEGVSDAPTDSMGVYCKSSRTDLGRAPNRPARPRRPHPRRQLLLCHLSAQGCIVATCPLWRLLDLRRLLVASISSTFPLRPARSPRYGFACTWCPSFSHIASSKNALVVVAALVSVRPRVVVTRVRRRVQEMASPRLASKVVKHLSSSSSRREVS